MWGSSRRTARRSTASATTWRRCGRRSRWRTRWCPSSTSRRSSASRCSPSGYAASSASRARAAPSAPCRSGTARCPDPLSAAALAFVYPVVDRVLDPARRRRIGLAHALGELADLALHLAKHRHLRLTRGAPGARPQVGRLLGLRAGELHLEREQIGEAVGLAQLARGGAVGVERLAKRVDLLRMQALRILDRRLGDIGGGAQAGTVELEEIGLLLLNHRWTPFNPEMPRGTRDYPA